MKKLILFAICTLLIHTSAYANVLPTIKILATGGTIAGNGTSNIDAQYKSATVPVDQLIQAVPELRTIANVSGEQISQIASQAMTSEIWLRLGKKINTFLASDEIDGVVVTHGTDTLEETAYFLNLIVKSKKPVVVVGSMRPPTAMSADGSMNLFEAVSVASHPNSRNKGVLVVLNDTIHGAREVTKTHTTNIASFQSPGWGPLGLMHNGEPYYYRTSTRKHTAASEFDIRNLKTLPKVSIIYGHADHMSELVDAAVNLKVKGLVIAGVGNGNLFPKTEKALERARKKGVAVVRSTRTGNGLVTLKTEVDDEKYGFVVADNLNPQKSRILLMLGLTQTQHPQKLQEMFFQY
jgi:L-asparaginase